MNESDGWSMPYKEVPTDEDSINNEDEIHDIERGSPTNHWLSHDLHLKELLEASPWLKGSLTKSLVKKELGYIPFMGMGIFFHRNEYILPS